MYREYVSTFAYIICENVSVEANMLVFLLLNIS